VTRYVLGVDPGLTTGLALLDVERLHWELVQVTPGAVLTVASALIPTGAPVTFAVEKFVVGSRAGASSTPQAGHTTRSLVGAVVAFGHSLGARVVVRNAAGVKPWSSNARLNIAKVPRPAGMGHAADAARHALFEAVHTGLLPDPLSRSWPR
jgi:hypothetical protein